MHSLRNLHFLQAQLGILRLKILHLPIFYRNFLFKIFDTIRAKFTLNYLVLQLFYPFLKSLDLILVSLTHLKDQDLV